MAEAGSRRVVAVLYAGGDAGLPDLDRLASEVELRYTAAAGLPQALRGADALLLWDTASTGALVEAWPAADSLEWLHVCAAGVDSLLFDELVASPVVVTNARGIFDRPIAEFVLGSVLAFVKRSQESYELQLRHEWRPRETVTLAGSTALVVGTGAIGREIARLLRAVGMVVRGAGRTARDGDPDFDVVVSSAELADHAGWADHLVVVAPLTPDTRGLVDARVLAAMKRGGHLVNVGRGPIVDEQALVAALEDDAIAGASLDVFGTEPLPRDHPLWRTRGVAVTPHMSGDAVGWQDRAVQQFLDNARSWLRGETLDNVVDKRLGFVSSR